MGSMMSKDNKDAKTFYISNGGDLFKPNDIILFVVNAGSHLVNAGSHLVNAGGHLVNAGGHLVNAGGHLVNAGGHLVFY